ncbi:MAG TPA: hypothetical protein VFZ65_00600 [Planctomycetota bacterium]|nr:hypothetical protein [Planctomycetota bacterium]
MITPPTAVMTERHGNPAGPGRAAHVPAAHAVACRDALPEFVLRRPRPGERAWRALGLPLVLTGTALLLAWLVYVVDAATQPW